MYVKGESKKTGQTLFVILLKFLILRTVHQLRTPSKNMVLLKNLQFSPNHYETLSKYGTHEYPILTKFRNDWVKIVDFLIKAYFCLVSLINEQSLG